MSLAFNTGVTAFSGHTVRRRKELFPGHCQITVHGLPTMKSPVNIKCNVSTTDLMEKIGKKFEGKNGNISLAGSNNEGEGEDIAFNLCIVDTFQRLGIDRYFRSEIHTILEDTFSLWQRKGTEIYSDITIHAMAFRLLRVKGYPVSSEELAPYADEERMNLQTINVGTVIELYRASEERIYEEERSLEKLHGWTTTFLMHQLQSNSIPDRKMHKLVEYYLKNYHGVLDRLGVRRNLELYDISHYPTLRARLPNLCNAHFLSFAKQDFNICQAQHQRELEQLQRWFAFCRFNTLKFGRDTVAAANFLTSAIISEPELSHVRLAFAKHMVLVVYIDDFFDHYGSRQDSFKILQSIKEWKVRPAAEYGSEEVEILFTAVYNTVNEIAEMAAVEQGRNVKDFLIQLWVELLSMCMVELDTWSDETAVTLDEYLSSSWVSISCRLCILMSMQFMGLKLSDEMLMSEECIDLCRHVSIADRLLNDAHTFERERKEKKWNSVSILLAARNGERGMSKEEAIVKIKEMAECERRKLMQIVYKRGSVFPRECKDMFLNVCRIGCYLYSSGDEFTSPKQMKEDIKSLIYEPLTLHS